MLQPTSYDFDSISRPAPVAVVIPTFGRGERILTTLERLAKCDPSAAETWVHVDASDGSLERRLAVMFPSVRVISSQVRVGPGGGRDRCLRECRSPYAIVFDDDSWPYDTDALKTVVDLFEVRADAAVIAATVWHLKDEVPPRSSRLRRTPSFTGCGHAMRLSAYREISGYVPRPVAYGVEETDVSMQLFARNWRIYESRDFRVFHDTELKHHESPEFTRFAVANVALLAFLRYPLLLWIVGLAQVGNIVLFSLKRARIRGLLPALLGIPKDCYRFRGHRRTLPVRTVWSYLKARRTSAPPEPIPSR